MDARWIINGDGGCRLWQPVQADSQPKSSGLVLGRRPLGDVLHSSNEPGELSQWLCRDNSTLNIVLDIITVWTVVQTVLTATLNSYGNRQISTPTRSIPLSWSTKKSAQLITSTRGHLIPNLVQINPPRASGQMGEIQKIIFYLYLFSQVRVQVRPVDGFLRATAQKTWNHARMCLLGSERCPPKFLG